jgi:hypothetical protein
MASGCRMRWFVQNYNGMPVAWRSGWTTAVVVADHHAPSSRAPLILLATAQRPQAAGVVAAI